MQCIYLHRQKGQSIAEIVVATAMVVLLVTGLVSISSSSIKANTSSRYRSTATKLTQEAMELSRSLRDEYGWNYFFLNYENTDWCIETSLAFVPKAASCPPFTVGSNPTLTYTREVNFVGVSVPPGEKQKIQVTVTVSWTENSQTRTSKATSYINQW